MPPAGRVSVTLTNAVPTGYSGWSMAARVPSGSVAAETGA